MKKFYHFSLIAILILAAALSGCGGGNSSSPPIYTGVAFTMVPVPAVSSFPTWNGATETDILGGGSVTNPYCIA